MTFGLRILKLVGESLLVVLIDHWGLVIMGKDLRSKSGYCCPYDKLPCKRFDYDLGAGACFTYDVTGRLKFVCRRFVAPAGFLIPKQLSPEE